MKKLFLVGAVALFSAVSAQEYKPTAGDVTAELGITGGISNTDVQLAGRDAYLKARYFKSDKVAYRFSANLGSDSNTLNIDSFDDQGTAFETHTTGKDKESETRISLGFGIEKHFTGTDRLSPYIGGDLMLGYYSQKVTGDSKTVNSGLNTTAFSASSNGEVKGPNSFSFGVRGVLGADYYFAKKVFLGVEAGMGVGFASEGKTTTSSTTTIGGTTTTNTAEAPGGSSFTLVTSPTAGLRIGFVF